MTAAARDKKYYVGREIGQLKARIANLEQSVAHYRGLVGERDKELHAATRRKYCPNCTCIACATRRMSMPA